MKINLQKLKPNDWIYFAKWWRDRELIALTSGNYKLITDEEIQKSTQDMTQDSKSHHWIIESDGEAIGHINLDRMSLVKAELQIVIGEKKFWGKGIGRNASNQVFQQAKNLGYQKIYIEVRPENARAIGLYRNLDFKNLGLKKYPKNPNMPEVIMMEKNI